MGHLVSMANAGLAPGLIAVGMATFTVWGIALSIGCLKTGGRLWLPFGIHYGVNICFSLIGWFFITSFNAPEWWTGNPAWAPESGLIGILVWAFLALAFYLFLGRSKPISAADSVPSEEPKQAAVV
jgi:hypothetical protein